MILLQCLYHPFLLLLFSPAFASLPRVDFDRMGKVGLAGSFAGLDFFDDSFSTVAFDPSTSTLLSSSPDGSLARLGSTNSGGRISAGCQLGNSFYFAGSFSSIGNASASNIASYTQGVGFSALGTGGPNGDIDALFCDDKNARIWAGGSFSSPGSSVAVWDTKASSWSAPPFIGLSGAGARVSSITTNASKDSLFFAGSFITSFQGNSSALNFTNNPQVPFSAGATPFTASLVPIPIQAAQIQGSPSTSDPQFANISPILCPTGPDGPGQSWFGEDGNAALITVLTFSSISASGVRLGNTFQQGRGTTVFKVTTIPDNSVRTLTYTDPVTRQNRSCSESCSLLTDSSIPFQDFLFEAPVAITGLQVELSQFIGLSPGLHIFQLLSSGAFASSIPAINGDICFAPNPSNTSQTGNWEIRSSNTNIPGTVQNVSVASVSVGTPSSEAPTFTWMPYVSASGIYDVNILVPGCNNFPSCARRTSIKVTIFPGNGLPPTTTVISQQNLDNAESLIYSGPIFPSTNTFSTTIELTLADTPDGQGQDGFYDIVADRVQFLLRSVDPTSTQQDGSGSPDSSSQGNKAGFGFFEWPIAASVNADARGILPNSTETVSDALGFILRDQLGAGVPASGSAPSIAAVVHHSSGTVFLAGTFNASSGAKNIAAFKDNSLSTLASDGLNGAVSSLVLDGDLLFVGGSFTDTATPSTQGALRNVAIYDISRNQWRPLLAGLNGPVSSISNVNGHIQIAGSFTQIPDPQGGGGSIDTGGFAVWSRDSSAWVNGGGYIRGAMTLVTNGSSSAQFVAGRVSASRRFGATGLVMLKNGESDLPNITPLSVQLQSPFNTTGITSQVSRRHVSRTHFPRSTMWFSRMSFSYLFSRQTNQPAPLPTSAPSPAPSVLTGVFWTNSSSGTEVVIIGGNFSFSSSSAPAQGLAIYNPDTGTVSRLQGPQVNGTVRALLVDKDKLYVGGEFTIPGLPINSLAVYDLGSQVWDNVNIPALQAPSAAPSVRTIKLPPGSNVLFVAGSFSAVGSLPCAAICSMDISSRQWNALGGGIRGDVSTVTVGGTGHDTLVVAGSVALTGSTLVSVAQYNIANLTWSAVGSGEDLPGPVTALEVNDDNINSIFAAGKSRDSSSSFLAHWNGVSWRPLASSLQGNTNVAQLTMVPVRDLHSHNDFIEQDRMLMVSGDLFDTTNGNFSAALYDGITIVPYIASSTSLGSSGSIASLFHSLQSFSFTRRTFLATGVVILISIAIAAGIVFLLALIGILWTLFSRRDDKLHKLDGADVEDDDDSTQHRPSSLLEHINAATRTTILGASPFTAGYNNEKGEKDGHPTAEHDPFGPDASNYVRAETPSDAVGGMLEEEKSRPARARYSFDGSGEGELQIAAGAELEVLDDRDAAWWYARDVRTGREGVVPAAYLY